MDYTKRIFRFDDVCGNSDLLKQSSISNYLENTFPDCIIIWGISPLTHRDCGERVYPKILNAYSDYRKFYEVNASSTIKMGPHSNTISASHGLIHVDHRLLHKSAQEISILVSCSLTESRIFIPPFNKWNKDTEDVCKENGIELVKFEDGWKCMEYENWDASHNLWYLHAREWTLESIKKWFDAKND